MLPKSLKKIFSSCFVSFSFWIIFPLSPDKFFPFNKFSVSLYWTFSSLLDFVYTDLFTTVFQKYIFDKETEKSVEYGEDFRRGHNILGNSNSVKKKFVYTSRGIKNTWQKHKLYILGPRLHINLYKGRQGVGSIQVAGNLSTAQRKSFYKCQVQLKIYTEILWSKYTTYF